MPPPLLVRLLRGGLQRHADPGRAAAMQAYLKTNQPFCGVQTPLRKEIFRQARHQAPLASRAEYEAAVRNCGPDDTGRRCTWLSK